MLSINFVLTACTVHLNTSNGSLHEQASSPKDDAARVVPPGQTTPEDQRFADHAEVMNHGSEASLLGRVVWRICDCEPLVV